MYNDSIKASIYKYYEKNKDKVDLYRRAYQRVYYAEKIENDAEFKAKEKERKRIHRKEKYSNDPEFRAKENEKRRALYYKKKAEKLLQQTINELPILKA